MLKNCSIGIRAFLHGCFSVYHEACTQWRPSQLIIQSVPRSISHKQENPRKFSEEGEEICASSEASCCWERPKAQHPRTMKTKFSPKCLGFRECVVPEPYDALAFFFGIKIEFRCLRGISNHCSLILDNTTPQKLFSEVWGLRTPQILSWWTVMNGMLWRKTQ